MVYAQMATENVGGVQYTVDADTSDLITAEAATKKFTTNTAKSFATAEASTKRFNTQVSGTAKAVRSARPDMQNMSYQLQDMAVQAQMGTSAFVIMAQQIPQMLVGMGAWAGAIGVAVTVLGLMATTMIDTTSDMEKLEKAIEQVKAVMTVGSNGVATYSDEMRKLSNISKELLQIKLNTALAAQKNAFKLAGDAAKQAYEDATPFFNLNWEAYKNQQEAVFDNIIDDKELKKLGMAHPLMDNAMNGVYGLNAALTSIKNGNLDAGIERITGALDLLSTSAAQNTEEGRALISTLTDIVAQYKEGKITVEQLTNAVNGNGEAFKGNADALQSFLQEIHLSNTNMLEGERAALKLRLAYKGMTDAQIATAMAAYDYNQKLVKQKEDTEAAIEADKKRKKSLDDVSASLDTYFDKESADSANQDRKATATLTTQVQSIGLTPEEEIQARYDRELELLQQAEEKGIEIRGTYKERREQLALEEAEALKNIHTENNQFLEDAFGNLDTQIAGTMAQVVVGAKDGETAMRDLASTMITQVVGALVQQGVELVKNKVLGNVLATSEKANILSTTATGVAAQQTATASTTAAAATTATAAAPAAALTSTFSFGSAALIGGAALLGTLAISKMMASGAREFGGPVTAGKSYLVGERGPEMFTPNTSGGIVSNKDMAGGGSGVSVNINNYSGQEVTQNYDEVRKIVTVEIGKQISGIRSGTGAMAKALKGTTTNKGRATKV